MTPTSRSASLIPPREAILSVLRSATFPVTSDYLADVLSVDTLARDGFEKRLAAMQRDGQLHVNGQGHFELMNDTDFVTGRAQRHRDGFGFVILDDGAPDIYLSEREMQKVMHNDKVQVRLTGYDRRGRPEGQVVEVLERANSTVIGRLVKDKDVVVVAPEDKRLSGDILLIPNGQGGAKLGQVVCVELTHFPDRYAQAMGRVVEVLGAIDDPGMEIEIAVRKFNVPYQFSSACLEETAALKEKVSKRDCQGRIDLRDIPLVTIDGEDARDFDDAVYCEPFIYEEQSTPRSKKKTKVNGWRLLVAIADVSHYVRPDHPLDADALERATSVYFPRRVIPMLPEKLSNGLCSLNPHVDRLCMVCDMVISDKGEIPAYQFYPAVMHSSARLTYTEVWAALSNTHGPEAHKQAKVMPHLQNLYELYQALAKARAQRGAIDFDTTESQIVCNAQGKIAQILPRVRNDAHKLIEECMLAANVCAADLLMRHRHPALYRVHGGPSVERLENLRSFLQGLGLHLAGGDKPQAADYARLLDSVRGRADATLIQTMVLRSFQQAIYDQENIGHFGLAYAAYAHFTSPIRRYPDLLVHRAIKAVLAGKQYRPKLPEQVELNTAISSKAKKLQAESQQAKEVGRARGGARAGVPVETTWAQLGVHCSANERRADEASRDVEAWLKCYFMRDKLGEEYAGTVSAVTSFGLFVQLENLFIEGLVHVTELGSDYFEYDEVRNELRGQRTGIRYRLTDRIHVQVSRVDLDARRIDFRMVTSPGMRPRGRGVEANGFTESPKKAIKNGGKRKISAVVEDVFPSRSKKKKGGKAGKADKAGAATSGSKAKNKKAAKLGTKLSAKVSTKESAKLGARSMEAASTKTLTNTLSKKEKSRKQKKANGK